jgi:uncharacterized protein (DUF488 family)
VRVHTIGFTKTTAERFFTRLQRAGVARVLDVRLDNVSQLAGFAKRDDLRYLLAATSGIGYEHRLELAPSRELLDAHRRGCGWAQYEERFRQLVPRALLADACLLCSEHSPDHCHRRLVAEHLARHWGDVEIVHL